MNIPDASELPEKRILLEATGIAGAVALVVLLLFILPAEHGVDVTGFGGLIGITGMGVERDGTAVVEEAAFRQDTIEVTVPAGRGVEYKFHLQDGSRMVYAWEAPTDLFYDFHGEPDEGSGFESYEVGTKTRVDGSFEAPFAGSHGWYWKNSSDQTVTVTLELAGHYEVLGLR